MLNKQKIIRLAWWLLVILPGIPFVIVSLALLTYMYWPRDYSSVTQFTLLQESEYITLSAHGVNDSKDSWSDELKTIMSTSPYLQLNGIIQQNHSIDWQKFSSNVFICSVVKP